MKPLLDDDELVGGCVGEEDSVTNEVWVYTWPLDVWSTKEMLEDEEFGREVRGVVVVEVLEVVPLVGELVVLGGTEVLLDDDDDDEDGVVTGLVATGDEVVGVTGVGDVGVVLVGEEGVTEVPPTELVVVGTVGRFTDGTGDVDMVT